MRNDHSRASFLSRWIHPRPTLAASDPADLGTAFGLDLSMEGGVPHRVDGTPPPSAATRSNASEGWLAWWRRRGD